MPGEGSAPILNYGRPEKRRLHSVLYSVLAVVVALLAILVLFAALFPHFSSPRASAPRVRSASNLREIGQAILLYYTDHGGAYPDSFQTILLNEDITSDVFVSPLSSDTPAVGPTTQAVAAQLTSGGHLSYVYLGRGLSASTATADTIVAYEKMTASMGGMNVLFGDGHVEWVDATTAAKIIARAAAGQFPVTMPSK